MIKCNSDCRAYENAKTLKELVDVYKKTDLKNLDNYLKKYKKLDFEKAVELIAGCKYIDENDNTLIHPHQYRIKKDIKTKMPRVLKYISKKPKDLSDFDKLHASIKKVSIKGYGKLAVYDVALRIGYYTKCLPDKVYLHAGVRQGAIALLGKEEIRGKKTLDKNDFLKTEEIKKIQYCYQIENFLCVTKNDLGRFKLKKY